MRLGTCLNQKLSKYGNIEYIIKSNDTFYYDLTNKLRSYLTIHKTVSIMYIVNAKTKQTRPKSLCYLVIGSERQSLIFFRDYFRGFRHGSKLNCVPTSKAVKILIIKKLLRSSNRFDKFPFYKCTHTRGIEIIIGQSNFFIIIILILTSFGIICLIIPPSCQLRLNFYRSSLKQSYIIPQHVTSY